MLDCIVENVEGVALEMTEFARKNRLLVGDEWDWDLNFAPTTSSSTAANTSSSITNQQQQLQQQQQQQQLPIVFAHGMGDSFFNNRMTNTGKHTSELLNDVYVTCIPTGDTKIEGTKNGYFLNMDKSVDIFASKIANDPLLKDGFHAIGFL